MTKDSFIPPLLSICIPVYNRPQQLDLLLHSVDCDARLIEIVICEDCSHGRDEIRQRVVEFKVQSPYQVRYIENQRNLGYDGNIRELLTQAR
jgi:abequosyltransferase